MARGTVPGSLNRLWDSSLNQTRLKSCSRFCGRPKPDGTLVWVLAMELSSQVSLNPQPSGLKAAPFNSSRVICDAWRRNQPGTSDKMSSEASREFQGGPCC